ncbi:hypothetical protein QQ045_029611 [Rhodiola kirilowii]
MLTGCSNNGLYQDMEACDGYEDIKVMWDMFVSLHPPPDTPSSVNKIADSDSTRFLGFDIHYTYFFSHHPLRKSESAGSFQNLLTWADSMKKRKRTKRCKNGSGTPLQCNLPTLIEALRNSKGLNQPRFLKTLYAFLVQLSSHCCSSSSCSASSTDFTHLCDALFGELCKQFQQLFAALTDVSSVSPSQQSQLLSSICATSEEFTLLLRCCLVTVMLPQHDQNLALDKWMFILSNFKRLCSLDVVRVELNEEIEFRRSLFQKSTTCNGLTSTVAEDFVAFLSFVKPSDACLPLLYALLEVLADEFLVHKSLRENLIQFDYLSSRDMLFANHSSNGDVRNVMELMANHFILSFSNEKVCDSILDRLSWHHRLDWKVSQLGLDQGVLLLLDSTFLSAPDIFQAHLVLIVSEAIGIDQGCMSTAPDVRLINCYLSAFQRSVILYTRHIYALHLDGESFGASGHESRVHGKSLHPAFDLFIRPETRHHFNRLLSKLDDYWHSWTKNVTIRTKAELVSTSFAYVEEIQDLFVDLCKEKMLSFIQALIMAASEEVTDCTPCEKVHASLPHIFLATSILKTMNGSLLQALRCLVKSGKVGNLKLLKDYPSSKEYDFIVCIISCFKKMNDCLPMPRHPLVRDLLQGSKIKRRESKQMLLHFSCLLSFGFRYKLDFLVKGCIFTLMTLLNLIIFEDGHLNAISPLLVYLSGASANPVHGNLDETQGQPQSIRKSSHLVASKFQKIQTLISSQSSPRSSTHIVAEDSNDEAPAMHTQEETCSGEMYFNCVFENSEKPSDVDDLSDFIEYKPGKDYSKWLKARKKYRKWKVQKMAVLRWEKRKHLIFYGGWGRPVS